MHPELRSQLTQLKTVHTPRAEFVQMLETRLGSAPAVDPVTDHFPAQIKHVFEHAVQLFLPAQFVPMANRFAALAIALGVTAGGWVSMVSASYNTVPGDTLYNVKLATEKVQIVAVEATGGKTKTAKLHTEFAERRANEVKQVIAQNKEPEQAKAAMALLTKSVTSASEALRSAQDDPATTQAAIQSTQVLLSDTERIAASLREVLETLPPNVSVLIDEIVLVQGQLTEKRLSTLQDIVRRQTEGKTSLTPEETREIIARALAQITTDAETTVTLAKQLTTDIAAASANKINTSAADTSTATSPETPPSAPSEPTSTAPNIESLPVTPPDITLTNIPAISETVSTEIQTVQSLVESGNLYEALTKAKEINTKQVEIESFVKKAVAVQKESSQAAAPTSTDNTTTPPAPTGDSILQSVSTSIEGTSTNTDIIDTTIVP
jgi:hypothetical protein